MINNKAVMPLLVAACPSFKAKWEAWKTENDWEREPLLYVALGEFARHLVGLYKSGRKEEFGAVFRAVEQFHTDGTDSVKEAATIGLLEGIQNTAGHEDLDPEVFVPFLGTESRRWWGSLDGFWDGKTKRVKPIEPA